MKNLKRKIVRLFGLALRSDLEKINEAYKKRDEDAKRYANEIQSLGRMHRGIKVYTC